MVRAAMTVLLFAPGEAWSRSCTRRPWLCVPDLEQLNGSRACSRGGFEAVSSRWFQRETVPSSSVFERAPELAMTVVHYVWGCTVGPNMTRQGHDK